MAKLFEIRISLPEEIVVLKEAEDEDEARCQAEDVITRAMEKGEFEVDYNLMKELAKKLKQPVIDICSETLTIVFPRDSWEELIKKLAEN